MSGGSLTQTLIHYLMRYFFNLLYQPLAWSYDLVASLVSGGIWKEWVMTVLPYLDGSTVLEIGHGPGHLQIALQKRGIQTYGIDASYQMGRQAKNRIQNGGFMPLLTRGYAHELPFAYQTFHQIVSTFPTAFIYKPETLQDVYRTLKPGGKLIMLPVAWITGKSLGDRIRSYLFRITDQAPDFDQEWLKPFTDAGFQTNLEFISKQNWSLVIISANKPDK